MGTPIRARLTFSFLLVLAIGMALAGTLAWKAVEALYLATQRENLLAQAQLTAAALGDNPVSTFSPEPYTQTMNVTPGIHTRLLNETGAVVLGVPFPEGENPIQVPPQEDPGFVSASDLLERPEIQAALKGKKETAVRKVNPDGIRVLYAAAPVTDENGKIAGLVYLATPLPTQGLPGEFILPLIGAILGAGLLAAIAGIYLARRIARPLENLDRAAAAVSAGDLTHKVPVEKDISELENLGRRFNQMTDSLRQSDQAKTAFIADVTHELRTPLTVIKGTVETLENGAVEDEEGRGALLSTMAGETERLIRLVNDLLLLTRADASALKLNITQLDLAQLVRDRCQLMGPLAASKDINLQIIHANPDNNDKMIVLADRDRTAQVLDNILDNAIRHSPEHSEITISLERSTSLIRCQISDQGPGIPGEHLAFVFERFYRADPARDRKSGGAGLGLAIARSLVKAQGGEIWAASSPEEGTRIVFELPSVIS
jgi:signal transduction histidine kinase